MEELESKLRDRLRRDAARVPDAVDAAILGAARDAARAFGRRRGWRVVRVAAAAAAAILVLGWIGLRLGGRDPDTFDIVDAYRVARGMVADEARFDLNGDGRVDRSDADAMLGQIVSLEPRRRS